MATATITPDQNAVIAEVFIAAPPARVFQAIRRSQPTPAVVGPGGYVSRDEVHDGPSSGR